jgi:Concanavalin A-like lectin/glucanases superfamily
MTLSERMNARMRLHAAVSVCVLAAVAGVVVGGSAQAAEPPSAPVCADTASSEAEAVSMARSCDRSVVVSSGLSETRTVSAQANGMLVATEHVVPVRARVGDGWAAIDTRLRVLAGGGVAPAVTTVGLRFSRGGSEALVSMTAGGGSLALSWPSPLPVPVIEGDTAVYREVLAGVDLRMRATAVGFTHVLVVKSRAAADNPLLRSTVYGFVLEGLTAVARADGGVDFRDASGAAVLMAAAGLMWDSSTGAGSGSSPVAPGDAARVAPVAATWSSGRLTVVPDVGLLTGPDTSFPVFVDPEVQATSNRWGYANTADHSQDPLGVVRVGRNPECCGGVWRSYFEFDVDDFAGKNVFDAKLNVSVTHTSLCDPATPLHLWHTADLPAGVNGTLAPDFLAMSQWLDVKTFQANTGCSHPSPVGGQLGGALAGKVKSWSSAGHSVMTLGLAVVDTGGYGEGGDVYPPHFFWLKVDLSSVYLTVWHNTAPNAPVVQPLNATTDCYQVCTSAAVASTSGTQVHGWWKLDETSGTVAADSSNGGRTGTASGGVGWSNGAALFNGSTASIATASSPVDATRSFTVSAWLFPVSGGPGCSIGVSQQAVQSSGFWLGTCGSAWEFGRSQSDTANAGSVHVHAPLTLHLWTHVVGVYNDLYDTFTLYVNGVVQGTAVVGAPYHATGGLVIGRMRYNGVPSGWWPGNVDNVQIYQREAGTAEIAALYAGGRGGGALKFDPAIVRTTTPQLSVAVSDPEPNSQLRNEFEVRLAPTDTTTLAASSGFLPPVGAPTTETWTVPAAAGLVNGTTYFWRARSHDELGWTGPWTPFQAFRVDTSPPSLSNPPVTSSQYPFKQWGAVVGTEGTFVLSSSSADTTQFEWWVDNGAHTMTAATGSEPRTASVTWTPQTDMVHTFNVMAKDSAGNISSTFAHQMWVKPPVNRCFNWRMDETTGTTAADSGNTDSQDILCAPIGASVTAMPGAVTANTGGAVGWTTGHIGGGLNLSGTGGQVATNSVVLDTSNSFTVMAWAKLTNLTGLQTLVSQAGANVSGFYLQYRSDANAGAGGFCMTMRTSDTGEAPLVSACASVVPQQNQWVHLSGVYNHSAGTLRVYVMGDPFECGGSTAVVPFTTPWSAGGPLLIGRAGSTTVAGQNWIGTVDDVYVFPRSLPSEDICVRAMQ